MKKLLIGFMILIGLYLYATTPKMWKRQDLKIFKRYHYAHRGLHSKKKNIPENSLAAFALAVQKGYGIELDIQLSKDGQPVVFHDYTLNRMCGVDKRVDELDWDALKKLRLKDSDETIPHLKEALALIDGKVPLLVEFKGETSDVSVCEKAIDLLDSYQGEYMVESFNPYLLVWFRKHRPQIVRGQLSTDFIKEGETGSKRMYFILKNLLLNFRTKPDFIAFGYKYRTSFTYKMVKRITKVPTIAWTVTSKEIFDEIQGDYDMFIFEKFDL